MIKAVVFDMDGVLFDTERISFEAWYEVAKHENINLNVDKAVSGCMGLNREDAARHLKNCFGEDFDVEAFRAKTYRIFEEKLNKNGLILMKGVREILTFLKQNKYPVALASSTSKKSILSHLKETGLTEYFDAVISGDMVKHSKPQPDIYLLACRSLNVSPEDSIAVEDSPNGIRSAYAAGMKAVMVPDMVEPTPEIEELLYKKCDSLLSVLELIKNTK